MWISSPPEERLLTSLYRHQIEGISILRKWDDPSKGRIFGGCFFLTDEMGLGKTCQVIETAQLLFEENEIDCVVVVCPASVRSVWFEQDTGELTKFHDQPIRVIEFHTKPKAWERRPPGGRCLEWYITNYDFIRQEDDDGWNEQLALLLRLIEGRRCLLLVDESSAVKNHKALQTKAVRRLRKSCKRVILMNGTPISNSPGDLFSQAQIMDHRIFNMNYWQFLARYAVKGGFKGKQIIGWRHPLRPDCCDSKPDASVHCEPGQGLDEINAKMAPYVLRREKKDCLDLPEKLPPISIEVPLTAKTWKFYKELRDQMLAWLDDSTSVEAAQAGVRAMRLAQVCSGFVGGISTEKKCPSCNFDPMCSACDGLGVLFDSGIIEEIGREKQKTLEKFLDERFAEDEKVLVWCRFRHEVERIVRYLDGWCPVGAIYGGQSEGERQCAINLLHPQRAPKGKAVVVGTPASGSMGLNLTSAWTVVYTSNDYALKTRLQSMDRVHRIGQTHAVSYFDLVACGPNGQRTIDHAIVKALRQKENVASWTVNAWKEALSD